KISKNVLYTIQQSKDNLTEPKGYGDIIKLAKEVYPIYQSQLLMNNCIDFSDILFYNLQIFRQYPDILNYYKEQFKYITVDEYQDTNELQYQWLLSLISEKQNICCVGDDDQSIYQWRGAKVDKILNFQQDFPNAKMIRLEQNYRSTKHILAAAYSIISNNRNRLDKEIWTDLGAGIKVKVLIFGDDYQEARYIINNFSSKIKKLSDMAILLRTTMQTRLFEEQCIKTNTPYAIVGGTKFYDRKEIKDVLAYLRIVYNNNDDMALERIINLPKRGIGSVTLDKLQSIALEENNSLMVVISKLLEISSNLINDKLAKFVEQICSWKSQLNILTLKELTKLILDDSGYMEMLKASKEDEERIQNINELVNSMSRYSTLEEFLEYISLINDHIENEVEEDTKGYISISTIHAAKGLEFRYVFLPGWEEGLFPHSRAIKSSEEEVEEERRLAYVGLTRAKELACISYCKERKSMYQSTFGIPSRFIKELNKNSTTIMNKT
ncbi:MAG: UvrD-helicase domain-containing protein, partial [Anaplasmataceae bacterium]|nr:UvrD-helicase domain-containing protein [Anaplasmataceae bacterium]